ADGHGPPRSPDPLPRARKQWARITAHTAAPCPHPEQDPPRPPRALCGGRTPTVRPVRPGRPAGRRRLRGLPRPGQGRWCRKEQPSHGVVEPPAAGPPHPLGQPEAPRRAPTTGPARRAVIEAPCHIVPRRPGRAARPYALAVGPYLPSLICSRSLESAVFFARPGAPLPPSITPFVEAARSFLSAASLPVLDEHSPPDASGFRVLPYNDTAVMVSPV